MPEARAAALRAFPRPPPIEVVHAAMQKSLREKLTKCKTLGPFEHELHTPSRTAGTSCCRT